MVFRRTWVQRLSTHKYDLRLLLSPLTHVQYYFKNLWDLVLANLYLTKPNLNVESQIRFKKDEKTIGIILPFIVYELNGLFWNEFMFDFSHLIICLLISILFNVFV